MTTSPPNAGQFEQAIRAAVGRFNPRRVIETGTHLGDGTTRILYEALRDVDVRTGGDSVKGIGQPFELITIECNPDLFKVAAMRYRNCPEVRCLHGLSVAKGSVPDRAWIETNMVHNTIPGIYYDHPACQRANLYLAETQCSGNDDQLRHIINHFHGRPDLILLDSAGHIGHLEFQIVLDHAKPPYVLILDDINHVKHFASAKYIRQHPREFEVISSGDERFGWMIALAKPG